VAAGTIRAADVQYNLYPHAVVLCKASDLAQPNHRHTPTPFTHLVSGDLDTDRVL